MTLRFQRFLAVALTAAMATVVGAADVARAVTLLETPPAVQKTIHAQVGNGSVDGIDLTNENGESTFEVSFTNPTGAGRGCSVADDGTLLSVEVALAETPAAVQQIIRAQASGWELDGIDKNVADTEPSFEVSAVKDGREKNFTVALAGDLLSREVGLAEAPAAVQAAVKTQLADGSLKSIDEDFDADGNTFQVTWQTKAGTEKSFSVAPDGRMLSQEVPLENTTPSARKTIREKIGAGKILRIDRSLSEKKAGVRPYAVQGRKDGKPFDFSVGPGGKFLGMDD